jgi:hypothetical protein
MRTGHRVEMHPQFLRRLAGGRKIVARGRLLDAYHLFDLPRKLLADRLLIVEIILDIHHQPW